MTASQATTSRSSRSCSDFKIYEEEGPPKGTNYNMVPRGDVIASIVGLAGAVEDRQPDVRAGDDDQDDRPVHARRQIDQGGNELGRKRTRRLHAVVGPETGTGAVRNRTAPGGVCRPRGRAHCGLAPHLSTKPLHSRLHS